MTTQIQTSVPNISYQSVYNRLLSQLPPWFGNQQYVPPPLIPGIYTATSVFNNVLWSYLITSFTAYTQFQYDFLQLRIGAYEIQNDANWPITIPPLFPFYTVHFQNMNQDYTVQQLITPVATNVTLVNGGSGYTVNDVIVLAGGTFNQPAVLIVSAVSGGVITAFTLNNPGQYAVTPANPVGQFDASGAGTGALFNVTFAPQFPIYPISFGNNLDIIAQDFFGSDLPRLVTVTPNSIESDNSYRNRILASVTRPKATLQGMLQALLALVSPAFAAAGFSPMPTMWYPLITENPGGEAYYATILVYLPNATGLGFFPGLATQGETITWGVGLGDPSITPSTPAIDIPPTWLGSDSLLVYAISSEQIANLIALTKVYGTLVAFNIEYVPADVIPTYEYNWVDNLMNNIVDNLGNQLIFNTPLSPI